MANTKKKAARFTLPARICYKRRTSSDFSARMTLIDRIADLAGIEAVERNDETIPCQVEVYLPRDHRELGTVWSVVEQAYDRLFGPVSPEAGTLVVSTWGYPGYSRTSLQ